MRLTDYLDKGASLGSTAPCLTMGERTLSYGEVQQFSRRFAASLAASGIAPGEKVAILSGNDPISFSCVFGISRAGGVWWPDQPSQRSCGKPRPVGFVRLSRSVLPKVLCAASRPDQGCASPVGDARLHRRRIGIGTISRKLARGRRTRRRCARRRHHAGRHRWYNWTAKGSDVDRAQHRDDDRNHLDELSVRGAPGVSGAGTADSRRRCSVLSRSWPSAAK